MHSIEYTIEEMDWPIDVSQPWLGSIPTSLEAVVTIEGNGQEWRVTAVNVSNTLGKESCFTILKKYKWATFHPAICQHVEAMLSIDQWAEEEIAELFAERIEDDKEIAAEYRAEQARDDAMLERMERK